MTVDDAMRAGGSLWAAARARLETVREALAAWLGDRRNARRLALVAVPTLLALGLLLPPVSIIGRVSTRGYSAVAPGQSAVVPSVPQGAWLEVRGDDLARTARFRLVGHDQPPRGAQHLPEGYSRASRVYSLALRGGTPARAWLELAYLGPAAEADLADAFGWDGERWRWLPLAFASPDTARVTLRPREFLPQHIVIGVAGKGATEVSAVALEPPASVPAAAAELPVIEMRAYHLADQDGGIRGQAFPVPTSEARRYGVLDNREGSRVRLDLANNMLIAADARQRHREAIVELVRRDGLDGMVLDYEGIRGDLQPLYADWLRRLADDLHRSGAELIVSLPMPLRSGGTWDGAPYDWLAISEAADGVRIRLPDTAPLTLEELDSLVRWALGTADRRRLQLAVSARGLDQVDSDTAAISYGDALARVLDIAQSDAPERIDPGAEAAVDLPTIRAASLSRDVDTGLWRFYYWDANRRRHTVWLTDAAGLKPVFDIAQRYRLGRIVLDGFSTGIDPSLWRMVQTFLRDGVAATASDSYLLSWRLVDSAGQVVQEAVQPLDQSSFQFRAPTREGSYQLAVNLIASDGRTMVTGRPAPVQVAPAPPPTPLPAITKYTLLPTPELVVTAPPPPDELRLQRTPVVARPIGTTAAVSDYDASAIYPMGELRAAPDFDSERISDLRPGEVMTVVERTADGSWLHVILLATGVEGWLRKELVDLRKPLHTIPVCGPEATPAP